jgi:hypothetical protein
MHPSLPETTQQTENKPHVENEKKAAAEDKARELLAQIRARGCTEPFTPAPELLDDGRVDFLAVAALTDAQLAEARAAAARAAKESRSCSVLVRTQFLEGAAAARFA